MGEGALTGSAPEGWLMRRSSLRRSLPESLTSQEGATVDKPIVARASTIIDAPVAMVWDALVTPETIKRYMFGTTVVSDWKEGSSIVWKGEWKGKSYED
jgi:hypothetical protein